MSAEGTMLFAFAKCLHFVTAPRKGRRHSLVPRPLPAAILKLAHFKMVAGSGLGTRLATALVSFPDPSKARASERGEEGSGENRQVLVTAAGMWAAPIRFLVAEYCAISHLANEL